MTDAVITAFIAGGATSLTALIGQVGAYMVQKKKSYEAHIEAQQKLSEQIEEKLDRHRKEYMKRIDVVEDNMRQCLDEVTTMRAQTQTWQAEASTWQAVYDEKINNLTEKTTKHNNFMEKLQEAQLDIEILKERTGVRHNYE